MTFAQLRAAILSIIGRAPNPVCYDLATTEINARLGLELDNLVADGDTNDILKEFPGLYLYGALAQHAALIRDEKAATIYRATLEAHYNQARQGLASEAFQPKPVVPPLATP